MTNSTCPGLVSSTRLSSFPWSSLVFSFNYPSRASSVYFPARPVHASAHVRGLSYLFPAQAGGRYGALSSAVGLQRGRLRYLPCLSATGTLPNAPSLEGSIGSRRWTSRSIAMAGAWRCSGTNNAELVKNLVESEVVVSPRVADAMQATDRGFYAPRSAYSDSPQAIGCSATISAPHMHGHAVQLLSSVVPLERGKVLDVGCGSGYLTGAFARLVGTSGVCYGMDYYDSLVALSKSNLDKDDVNLLASGNVCLKTGDGWKGWPEHAPFDAIHVGAAAERIPEELVRQLKVGGRMVIPVGPAASSQTLVQVDRTKGDGPLSESYTRADIMSVIYVPLVAAGAP